MKKNGFEVINKLILFIIILSPCSGIGQGLNDVSVYIGYSGSSSEQLVLNSSSFPKSLVSSIDISLRYLIKTKSKLDVESELGYQYISYRHKVFSTFISSAEQSTLDLSLSRINFSLLTGIRLNDRWKVYSGLDFSYFIVPKNIKNYKKGQFMGSYQIYKTNLFSTGLPISLRYKINVNSRSIILNFTLLKFFYKPFTIELNGKYTSNMAAIDGYQYLFHGDSLKLGFNIPLI